MPRALALALLLPSLGTPRALHAQSTAPGDWPMPAGDYAASRFSPLAQITAANAPRLRVTWSFSTGVLGGHEGQPLVVGNTMYVVTPWPNVLYAFDLTKEGYPLRWKYRPDVSGAAIGQACCDLVNRGVFYAAGKLVYNLLDGHTVAVDERTGRELWKTQVADVRVGETLTMAPLVVRDHVIVGAAGGEYGIRGWIKGLDLATGRVVWTGYNTGPDSETLARPGTFKPFYQTGAELSLESWPKDAWRHGGAPVWGWLSYDPALNLVYYGTGNPAPYNAEQRPGDNRWATSVLARNPEDGSLRWAYQFTPADNWDYDSTQEMILTELELGGRRRRVLVHFDKNGFAYTLDRATGEVLSQTRGPRDRPAGGGFHEAHRRLARLREEHLPHARRREEPAARGVVAGNAAVLRPHEQHVHGLPHGSRGVHRRHALRRSVGRAVPRSRRREPRRVHRLGPDSRQEGVGDPRAVSGLERRPRHRGRPGLLRHARRLVQGRRRAHRQGALEAQSGLGGDRESDRVPGSGREGAHRGVRGLRRRLGTHFGRREVGRSDRCAPAGAVHARHREAHEPGRHRVGIRPVSVHRGAALVSLGVLALGARNAPAQQAPPPAVRYEQHVSAGGHLPPADSLADPFAGDTAAAREGEQLFTGFNCAGCHGGGAVGNTGPSLADGRWRYGGSDGAIYTTIFYGRPRGMPAFGGSLPGEAIWKLVAYLRSLQPATDTVATRAW
jgi:mono/diheme cytochrome c family protein